MNFTIYPIPNTEFFGNNVSFGYTGLYGENLDLTEAEKNALYKKVVNTIVNKFRTIEEEVLDADKFRPTFWGIRAPCGVGFINNEIDPFKWLNYQEATPTVQKYLGRLFSDFFRRELPAIFKLYAETKSRFNLLNRSEKTVQNGTNSETETGSIIIKNDGETRTTNEQKNGLTFPDGATGFYPSTTDGGSVVNAYDNSNNQNNATRSGTANSTSETTRENTIADIQGAFDFIDQTLPAMSRLLSRFENLLLYSANGEVFRENIIFENPFPNQDVTISNRG